MKEFLSFLRAFIPKFKGEIWENAGRYKLIGAGYKSMPAEQDGHFDLRTANHLRGILRALNDPDVEIIIIVGATQVLKSLAGDIWVVHIVEHESDSILVIFEDDPKAKLYVSTRLMETLRQHPEISKMLSGILEDDPQGRHRIANTRIKFAAGRVLEIGGANDGMLSSLSWRFLWGSEPWQWKPGMLGKFIKRADRYAGRRKILLESQAGMAGDDFHSEASAAHAAPLTWACPFCGGRQSWECAREYDVPRPADFKPLRPVNLPPGQLELWTPPVPNTIAGMKIPAAAGDNGQILTMDERARLAKWECYHCGILIDDIPAIRLKISESYDQDYTLPPAFPGFPRRKPKSVCFTLPRESNYANTFESGVLSYLKAKEAQASGNEILLENWYLSERAVFYGKELTQTRVALITGTVQTDAKGYIPNEAFRGLLVDCQKDIVESLKQGKDTTGHFWYVAEATDRQGNTFQLARGYATSWGELFGLGGIKEQFKIPTRNVAIDGGNWFDLVKEKAAQYRTKETALDGSGRMVWATWKIMVGDEGKGVRWEDGVWRSYWPPKNYEADILEPDGKTWRKISVPVTRWSNFAVKSILHKLKQNLPGQPRFVPLPFESLDKKTQAKETPSKQDKDIISYDAQMNGFSLGEDSKGKAKFLELHKNQHYPDCHCMGIVLKMMIGLVRGETAAAPASGQEADKKLSDLIKPDPGGEIE